MTLIRVVAPHFVAGLLLDDDWRCVTAAPILQWAVGKDAEWLVRYFKRKGWEACVVPPLRVSKNR